MSKLKNLSELLIYEGRQLYDSTCQELTVLPDIVEIATSKNLKKIILKQIRLAERQQKNILLAFDKLEMSCDMEKCKTTMAILQRMHHLIRHTSTSEAKDAGIISSLQQLSHRKIAGFGTVATYGMQTDQKFVAIFFHKALEDEIKIDNQLSMIAEKYINKNALHVPGTENHEPTYYDEWTKNRATPWIVSAR